MLIKRDGDRGYVGCCIYITVPCTLAQAPTVTNRWQNIKKLKKKIKLTFKQKFKCKHLFYVYPTSAWN